MKKIAIVTITRGENVGNRLQNYALQQVLSNLNFDTETLNNYNSNKDLIHNLYCKIKRYIYILKMIVINKKFAIKRIKFFKDFNNKNIKFSKYCIYYKKYDKKINRIYDFFIAGSDQIWNPNYKENAYNNFLMFTSKEKSISYAASFGSSNIPQNRKSEYKNYLKHINHLSVREEAGKQIVEELTGRKDVEVLVDPTMLLSANEWDKVSNKPIQLNRLNKKKYILNYFLGDLPKEWNDEINRVALENDCDIINILDKKSDFYKTGPSEFLYLEKNAFLIFTDSFHSCVFALIYKTPFIVFSRQQKGLVSMNSRLDTLLSKFNMQDRKFSGKITKELINCDFSNVDNILKEEREKSDKFLKKALNIN